MRRNGRYTAFFGVDDVLSNWHPCSFTYHGISFSSVEQFMMYSKAKLFDDEQAATRILAVRDPRVQKRFGREVAGFDEAAWIAHREAIVYVGCREKFLQNEKPRAALLATANTVLVEASPYDRIWGVGLAKNDPLIADETAWRGLNLLGIALMKVRDTLKPS
ncbi:hypothetical protein B0G84_7567 [Paraburkholderia sp. BL8N3]|nr:NADAR family protein [Paraburkholderia sp. BL8N3]TCK33355.1 hypothetical protein B0G84_7567 [Paraburkholderia sp. BL8N3]